MPTLLTTVAALLLHLLLGWASAPAAAVVSGWVRPEAAARRGALAMVLAWGGLIGWAYVRDAAAASRAMGLLGGVLGGLPGAGTVLLTLLIASLLGALAGVSGAAARHLRPVSTGPDPV